MKIASHTENWIDQGFRELLLKTLPDILLNFPWDLFDDWFTYGLETIFV